MDIEQHYRKHYRHLVKVATRNVIDYNKAMAEECVQQAYMKILQFVENGGHILPNSEEALLYRTLFNCIHDSNSSERLRGMTGRGKNVEFNEDHVDTLSEIEDGDLELHSKMALKLVVGGFKTESPRVRQILHMFFVYGYSHPEISGETGCTQKLSRNVVYTHLKKIRSEV